MANFETLEEYLIALKARRGPAIVPITLVAEHLGVSRAAVDRMLKIGQLRSVRIDGTRFVDAESLAEREQAFDDDVAKVRGYLEIRARAGQRIVFYDPVMSLIGRDWRIPADRKHVGGVLGAISEATHREYNGLLSVLVHRKTLGRTLPGPGFFDLCKSLGRKWKDPHALVEAETKNVLSHYRRK